MCLLYAILILASYIFYVLILALNLFLLANEHIKHFILTFYIIL